MENNEELKQEVVEEVKKEVKEETNESVPVEPKKKNNKKIIIIVVAVLLVISIIAAILLLNGGKKEEKEKPKEEETEKLKELPLPEVTGGERGQLGIDKNINESNIDEYLNRSDSVYRDMRMLDDPAKYENIGGDRFLSGYIKGFEVVPLPYLIPVTGLPDEVGKTYNGKTLFSIDKDGNYVPNYDESMSIIEELFPKDKVIFLMCGGGGYAGMTKTFLVSLGWDETKIYNTGGYWYYDGKNNVEVTKVDGVYDFSNVPYHEIKFDELTLKLPINLDDIYYEHPDGKGTPNLTLQEYKDEYAALAGTNLAGGIEEQIEKATIEKGNKINQMLDNKESFVILLNQDDFCFSGIDGEISLASNLSTLARDNFSYYDIGLKVYKKSRLYQTVKYAPTVIIIYKGEILAYTNAESDEDLKYSNSREEFNKWFTSYVKVNK